PNQDRSLVWKLTRERYYGVPIVRDGKNVIFEMNDDSQVVAKYIDEELELGLFPARWRGVQSVLWTFIENEIEGATFRLNDIYWKKNVPAAGQLQFLRFKERKFGRGCIDQWRKDQRLWLKKLEERLIPFEIILSHQQFLLDDRPRFVDFDLFGMLENFLYSGQYELPARHKAIKRWHATMSKVKITGFPRK
ncbi:MAG: glutathione S-transferase family protein, partial [Limisphaerales bacterium]